MTAYEVWERLPDGRERRLGGLYRSLADAERDTRPLQVWAVTYRAVRV